MILTVLKVTGIVLLVILGLLIFILGMLLFVPIRYRFAGSFYSVLQAEASVKWRPVMLNAAVFCENQEVKYVIKLFGQVVMTNTDKKISWLGRKFFAFDEEEEDISRELKEEKEEKEESREEQTEGRRHFEKESGKAVTDPGESRRENTGRKREKKSDRKTLLSKIRGKIRDIREKLQLLMNKLKKINSKKDALLKVYHSRRFELAKRDIIDYVKEILAIIKPDELEGFVHFGLDNPADTGQVLGIISMALPLYDGFLTVEPDFEKACLEGNLKGNGKIRLYSILKLALKVIFNKNLIKVTKKVQTIIEA